MLDYLCKLAPIETGPWWHSRLYVLDRMRCLNVKPGDIVCRLGNAINYGFFWFSKFIANLTHSKYSHAAIVLEVGDDILLGDVNTTGLRRQYVVDWVDDVRGDDIIIMRYNGDPHIVRLAVENAKSVISLDDFLDSSDGRNFYCVELVCWCYLRAGALLCKEIPIGKLPGWKTYLNPLARLHGIDINKPVWCVGNEKIGLLASPHLSEVGKIVGRPKRSKKEITFSGV